MDPGKEFHRDILDEKKNPQYIRSFHRNRKQKYDKRGQLHSVTQNHQLGQKLPMVVKFPYISEEFEKIDDHHPYANHRLGIYNGLYVVPENPSSEFNIPSVKISAYDPVPEFFNTPHFKLLDHAFNLVYKKLILEPALCLNRSQCKFDYTQDKDLKKYSK